MNNGIIHIFIVDKNAAWREAKSKLPQRQADMEVIGSAADLYSAFYRILSRRPHVVLCDDIPQHDYQRALYAYLDHTILKLCFIYQGYTGANVTSLDLTEGCPARVLPKGTSPAVILNTIREVSSENSSLSRSRNKVFHLMHAIKELQSYESNE